MSGHFNVLKPIYTPDGVVRGRNGQPDMTAYAVSWGVIGTAQSMEDAKQITARPVLEWVPARRQGGA